MKVPYDVVLPQVSVLGSTMAYREAGNPDAPVALFLHGNPTSSYLWRNVIPLVAPTAHCIAPDLIGFGQSGKPDIEYRFADHVRYLNAFLANAGISSAFVIAHDWGTALAFHLAARRPEFIRGLAFMEFLRPLPTWEDFPASGRETFKNHLFAHSGRPELLEGFACRRGKILPGRQGPEELHKRKPADKLRPAGCQVKCQRGSQSCAMTNADEIPALARNASRYRT